MTFRYLYQGRIHDLLIVYFISDAFNALALLVGRQEEHPARKNRVMRCWRGCLSGADLTMGQWVVGHGSNASTNLDV